MQLTKYFLKKLHDEMKIIDIIPNAPKTRIRLDPIDPEDLCVDLEVVEKWSRNNSELLHLIFENGMAAFICNRQFIFSHYQQLTFINKGITKIDKFTYEFQNLRILNLAQNNISEISHIPINLEELYLDFNRLTKVHLTKAGHRNLHLLSISHNNIDQQLLSEISSEFAELICLNVAANAIADIRKFVQELKRFKHLKILTACNNPVSLLKIYYEYVTENIQLKVFDGEKYVKPQPPKKVPPPKKEVKQEPKEEKKDPKKDAKKGAKQPQPPKQQIPKPEPIVQVKKKELTEEDFTKCSFKLSISNLEGFTGNLYDPSIFPADHPVQKTQSTYWIEYSFMETNQDLNAKKVRFDEATVVENEPNRLNFALNLTNVFNINQQNKEKFQRGIFITVHSEEPAIETTETGEQKPIKQGDNIVMKRSKIGSVFVDLRDLLLKKDKTLEKLFRLWPAEICSRPYFKDPIPTEEQQISKRRAAFEQSLKKEQEQRAKQLQEEEAAKNQKKGGKDQKKVDKKVAKKQGKDVVSQKKGVEKSTYRLDSREYCYLNENKIHKSRKETLAVRVAIE